MAKGTLAEQKTGGQEERLARSGLEHYRGCFLGGAVGDALGAAVEFMSLDEIRRQFGPRGIQDPAPIYGRAGAVTDDTQMLLFTAEGLLRAHHARQRSGIASVEHAVCWAYWRWLRTQGERPLGLAPAYERSSESAFGS